MTFKYLSVRNLTNIDKNHENVQQSSVKNVFPNNWEKQCKNNKY